MKTQFCINSRLTYGAIFVRGDKIEVYFNMEGNFILSLNHEIVFSSYAQNKCRFIGLIHFIKAKVSVEGFYISLNFNLINNH